jgi:hypothetical protein
MSFSQDDNNDVNDIQAPNPTSAGNLKPVFIGMIVASSLPLLFSVYGLLFERVAEIGILLSIANNGFVVAASAILLRSRKHYWLAISASLLTFLGWFWLSFEIKGTGVLWPGTGFSIVVGIWAFLTLRTPKAKAAFENQADPIGPVLGFITSRIPKLALEPTPTNVNRVTIAALAGMCLVGCLAPGVWSVFSGDQESASFFQEAKDRDNALRSEVLEWVKEGDRLYEADGNKLNVTETNGAYGLYRKVIDLQKNKTHMTYHITSDLPRVFSRTFYAELAASNRFRSEEMKPTASETAFTAFQTSVELSSSPDGKEPLPNFEEVMADAKGKVLIAKRKHDAEWERTLAKIEKSGHKKVEGKRGDGFTDDSGKDEPYFNDNGELVRPGFQELPDWKKANYIKNKASMKKIGEELKSMSPSERRAWNLERQKKTKLREKWERIGKETPSETNLRRMREAAQKKFPND